MFIRIDEDKMINLDQATVITNDWDAAINRGDIRFYGQDRKLLEHLCFTDRVGYDDFISKKLNPYSDEPFQVEYEVVEYC